MLGQAKGPCESGKVGKWTIWDWLGLAREPLESRLENHLNWLSQARVLYESNKIKLENHLRAVRSD